MKEAIYLKDGRRGAYVVRSDGGSWNNQQLLKDCGIIPYMLHKNHGFRAVMPIYADKMPDFPYLETYVKGLEFELLPDDTLETRIKYICEHSEDIDLLILYGAYNQYIPMVHYYKEYRPDGKVYLATDMNMPWAEAISYTYDLPEWRDFLSQCDVIAASCRKTQRYLNMKWPFSVELIRNGWYNAANVSFDDLFAQKENIILTVARIGVPQKNHELLLETFAACSYDIPNWRLKLIGEFSGSEEEQLNFKKFLNDFFTRFSHLKDRIEFTGLIEDKLALAEEFKKAKIFILTSNFEGGAPNVIGEALHSGCYIIVSDIDAADDCTDEGRCGSTFPIGDKLALTNTLKHVCNNNDLILGGG